MKPTIRFHAYWLLGVLLGLLVLEWFDSSKIWLTMLMGVGLALLLAGLWARSLARHLQFTREVRYGWAQVGDQLEEHFRAVNSGGFPATWVEIVDHSTIPNYSANIATTVPGRAETEWYTQGKCTRRGLYMLGGTSLRTGDPLGLFTVTFTDPSQATLMVMPPVVSLPSIPIIPGGHYSEGRPRPRAPEETVGAAGVRSYLPGDSVRLIHWPTSARRGSLYVRQFDGAPSGDWWVLLDLDEAVQRGSGWKNTEEHAVILAASLAARALEQRQPVGLIASGSELVWLPPKETVSQRWDILRALALVRPGKMPLAELIERVRPGLSQRSSLVIITASRSGEWIVPLQLLMRKGIQPVVIWLDTTTFVEGEPDSTTNLPTLLQAHQIPCHVIRSDLLNQTSARPGHQGVWDWKVSSITGKVRSLHPDGNAQWRRLG